MPLDVIMPALGMAQETGQIVAWHKQPGDAVAKGDILFEVETDKATMEVEAAADGFLTDVTANEGADVPVGHVIAKISDSAESAKPAPPADTTAAPAPKDDLPEGKAVIMPTLGMAQDSGLLVAWHKQPGDPVSADDILFEVETDKSTNEVNAGFDGYLGATLAQAGEDVPTGQTIAIITAEKPDNPVTRQATTATAAKAEAPDATHTPVETTKAAKQVPVPASNGRILASPKLRRLAHEQGLDLQRLVDAGHAQPFHVRDLDALRALPEKSSGAATARASGRLTAEIATEGFSDFAVWAAETAHLTDVSALLAGLCAASKGTDTTVAVESFGTNTTYAAKAQLSATQTTENPPELRLRDLRFTSITGVAVGAEDVPTLTLTRRGPGLTITLEFAPDQMDATHAITLLSNFAGRMEQPLRHLL